MPAKEHFFNTLTDSPISTAEYEHAANLWKDLKFETLSQFCAMYLTLDTVLLGQYGVKGKGF